MRRFLLVLGFAAAAEACAAESSRLTTDDEIPDSGYCHAAREWHEGWGEWEGEVVELVNEHRRDGAVCGGIVYDPRPPLKIDHKLRCAARKHALDMQHRGYIAHRSPEGGLPPDRMRSAGYRPRRSAENIAVVSYPLIPLPDAAEAVLDATHFRHLPSPARAVDLWMHSRGHCETIMDSGFEHTGVGYLLTAEGAPMFIQAFGHTFD